MTDKQSIRESIWSEMKRQEVSLFPGPEGRIPNFTGRKAAAESLFEHPVYQRADTVKINPDSPQTPVRERAFDDGKTLYMAVPKLEDEQCFLELDPQSLDAAGGDVRSIGGASEHGDPVHPSEMPEIDLIVTGSVGVDPEGHRLGKGGGYSDLEFALLLEFELIHRDIPIWTTVHPIQVRTDGPLPAQANDITLSGFATPDEQHEIHSPPDRPRGIDWDRIPAEKIHDIPVLERLHAARD